MRHITLVSVRMIVHYSEVIVDFFDFIFGLFFDFFGYNWLSLTSLWQSKKAWLGL